MSGEPVLIQFQPEELSRELLRLLFDTLNDCGYMTEHDDGPVFVSSVWEALTVPAFFSAVVKHHFPGEFFDFQLSCLATDEGGPQRCFDYALFDNNRISRAEVTDILRRQRQAFPWDDYLPPPKDALRR